eukprot:gene7978-1424_t
MGQAGRLCCLQLRNPVVHSWAKCLPCRYNTTGTCICSDSGVHATCVQGKYPAPTSPAHKQYLVIGDSISLGYFASLKANISQSSLLVDVVHAPGNCDNTNWGRRCLAGWLGPDPGRWDLVSMNWGLHDLAHPDNEHLEASPASALREHALVGTYAKLLSDILNSVKALAPEAKTVWATTTPVPTDPPPDPKSGKSCALIPGRLEQDVISYNVAAKQ